MTFRKSVLTGLAAAGLMAASAFPALSSPYFDGSGQSARTGGLPIIRIDDRHGHHKKGFYQNNGRYYYNGHRGYRKPHKGYKQYNGWWFPAGAFGVRVVPAPAHSNAPRRARGFSPAHYQWCDQRYRSYRAADNSFQPYNGPRRACVSPYGR